MPNEKPNAGETRQLEPGTLWAKAIAKTESAKRCGALQFLATESEFVEQGGINFLVRVLPHLARKAEVKKNQDEKATEPGKEFNPFLPYDEDLFVSDISETHLCLLNKFSIIDYHLLMITRAFEEQETWLTLEDFTAMWLCLKEIDGLVFYNGGKTAGASQRHKHLQLVPLPLIPQGLTLPIEPAIAAAIFQDGVGTLPHFPFVHAIAKLDFNPEQSSELAALATLECYHNLLRVLGLLRETPLPGEKQSGAYNLLATRSWLLLVPRTRECYSEISVNSLGFAGTLVVRSFEEMELLKDKGPMTVLRSVAVPTTDETK